ncbi:DALR anticodon-binding domain-containing protein [Sphaerisporangium corydalis]|uniref:DALR anticodon-binding domain-containing protein n=1 Tax=Sphaerisporangium corydalis TaxID=1441875 RepID=A0ABV9EKS4_9ACTN|nr:DALR anticodon-binding domain-containing protein [Sphaerisporangium corydalis]
MDELRAILGSPPVPRGSWAKRATYVSTAALVRPEAPEGESGPVAGWTETARRMAAELRDVPGVASVDVRRNGFLVIEIAVPGVIVADILGGAGEGRNRAGDIHQQGDKSGLWPDFPRTWSNPGFVVRYAYVRADAVQRWARELGLAAAAGPIAPARATAGLAVFRPESLGAPADRAVLRVLAELPSRRVSRDPGWPAYLERLAGAYHDAFERAPALPKGDEAPSATHAARVRLARAVREVLAEGLAALGVTPPSKI